jgi:hypothetical protein
MTSNKKIPNPNKWYLFNQTKLIAEKVRVPYYKSHKTIVFYPGRTP